MTIGQGHPAWITREGFPDAGALSYPILGAQALA